MQQSIFCPARLNLLMLLILHSISKVIVPNVSWLGHLSGVVVGLICISDAAACYVISDGKFNNNKAS